MKEKAPSASGSHQQSTTWVMLVAWVALGMSCGGASTLSAAPAAGGPTAVHWAYQPLSASSPSPPLSSPRASKRNSIVDLFVRQRLERHGITASTEAPPHTLIRRLFADLLGLPPTREQVRAFASDYAAQPEAAWSRLVEHCLASPHFGERWGRHWLDQARYADSDGYEKDSPRPDAWRYREWVIDSINRDQPFDQFTLEQLAGDLLPNATPDQRLATAFHRQTLTNREGGVEQEQYRVEAVFDRVETTATVWLGMTLGCARCHDHKYERLSQKEYFQLYAFFDNADEANARVGQSRKALEAYNAAHPNTAQDILTAERRLEQERAALAKGFAAWEANTLATLRALEGVEAKPTVLTQMQLSSPAGVSFDSAADGSWSVAATNSSPVSWSASGTIPRGLAYGVRVEVFPEPNRGTPIPDDTKAGSQRLLFTDLQLEVGGKSQQLHSPKADFEAKEGVVANLLDGKDETGWSVAPRFDEPHHATFYLPRPIVSDGNVSIRFTLKKGSRQSPGWLGRFRLNIVTNQTEDSVAPPDVRRLARIGIEKWTEPDRERLFDWLIDENPTARAARDALQHIERGAQAPLMSARVLAERPEPRDTRLLHRGEYLHPRDPVQPDVPKILPPLPTNPNRRPNRLDLARWIVSPTNPLTARVAANQIWLHLLGDGLVRTPADFGTRGEPPSHPELLDELAGELIRSGWSRKHLIRQIVHSQTYRQSSHHRPDLEEPDPLNRLFARQNRVRVEGEIVRDYQLAISGLLHRGIGGPSVYPALPPDVAEISYANNFKWPESKGADRYRRGMYTFFKRTAPHPDLVMFDCPDANLTQVRRNISNTPLQALTLLNGQTFTEAALQFARRLMAAPGLSDAERLTEAFETCVARGPAEHETAALLKLLADSRSYYQAHPQDAALLTSDPNERSQEMASWMATVRVLLNTDELLTRD
ncbi:MAG: DUF1553 domain-containing protein [Verrucomicrobiales bacterium]|nr:DUF1553 domain-containing protein [Verrucomicrobiales bacterium]